MRRIDITVIDNRSEWQKKELNRLFPGGDHGHICWLMNMWDAFEPWSRFYPRLLKKIYEPGMPKQKLLRAISEIKEISGYEL